MKKIMIIFLVIVAFISLVFFSYRRIALLLSNDVALKEEKVTFKSISMAEAKKLFETEGDYIILDVRRKDEFVQGHIKGAINIANEDISDVLPNELKDKDKLIYVYCRSGNRSKKAAQKLAMMGYTNIVECGGILDWDGELVK